MFVDLYHQTVDSVTNICLTTTASVTIINTVSTWYVSRQCHNKSVNMIQVDQCVVVYHSQVISLVQQFVAK